MKWQAPSSCQLFWNQGQREGARTSLMCQDDGERPPGDEAACGPVAPANAVTLSKPQSPAVGPQEACNVQPAPTATDLSRARRRILSQ